MATISCTPRMLISAYTSGLGVQILQRVAHRLLEPRDVHRGLTDRIRAIRSAGLDAASSAGPASG
jgi:hypothetical protein